MFSSFKAPSVWFLNLHSARRHRVTALAPNHYNMINATQGNLKHTLGTLRDHSENTWKTLREHSLHWRSALTSLDEPSLIFYSVCCPFWQPVRTLATFHHEICCSVFLGCQPPLNQMGKCTTSNLSGGLLIAMPDNSRKWADRKKSKATFTTHGGTAHSSTAFWHNCCADVFRAE